MLGVRRTAESNEAKRMPMSGPRIRALKGLGERPRMKFLHHSGAGVHIGGIGRAQRACSVARSAQPRVAASSRSARKVRAPRK